MRGHPEDDIRAPVKCNSKTPPLTTLLVGRATDTLATAATLTQLPGLGVEMMGMGEAAAYGRAAPDRLVWFCDLFYDCSYE